MISPWTLRWHHFGDLLSAIASSGPWATAFRAHLLTVDVDTLRGVFSSAAGGGVPSLVELVRKDVVLDFERRGLRRGHTTWDGTEFEGFRVQIADIVDAAGQPTDEALLFPDALFLPASAVKADSALMNRLASEEIEIETAPVPQPGQTHLWVSSTMAAGDILTKCHAPLLSTSDSANVKAALRVAASDLREGKSIDTTGVNAPDDWPSKVSGRPYTDIGVFEARPARDTMERRFTFLTGSGTADNGQLVLHLGTETNTTVLLSLDAAPTEVAADAEADYNPWPCGGFIDCSMIANC